jgi:hypothetical protein
MKKVLFIIILFQLVLVVSAQDVLTIKNKHGAPKYRLKGGWVQEKTVLTIIKDNEQAVQLMKEARTNKIWGTIFSTTGGFMVGYPVGVHLAKGEANWNILYMGIGVSLLSIPFNSKYNKLSRKAVKTYQDGLKTETSFIQKISLESTPHGISLIYNF